MKDILLIVAAFFFIAIMLAPTGKAFSQVNQPEDKTKLTDSTISTPNKDANYVKGITTRRAVALAEGLLGLLSVIVGWRAKARYKKNGARTAMTLGLLAVILSSIHLATTAGAVFGSGSGKAGSILALLLGIAGITLGSLTLRSHNTNKQ